ncbi:MAG: hypothetical protein HY231_11800 [Acidobacteria bacterium]|nr:hypothetical protein [Acidobacteriota bacterium]
MPLTKMCLRKVCLSVLALTFISCSQEQASKNHLENRTQPRPSVEDASPQKANDSATDILMALGSNNIADARQVEKFPRHEVIKALQGIETEASETRALGIAYLFVILKHDAAINSAKIRSALRECGRKDVEIKNFSNL